jgi:hypothetical protein
MKRSQFLDLDLLDSPLISANSVLRLSSPPSSIAEKIFNDPDSWHNSTDSPIGDREAMEWLADELKKDGDHLADGVELSPIEQDIILEHVSGQYKLTPKPTTALHSVAGRWESVLEDDDRPFLPVIERSSLMDLKTRLSKFWDHGNTFAQQSLPSPIIFSPPSTSGTSQSVKSPNATRTDVPSLAQSEELPTPLTSPASVVSASTTWSILELYGVHPDTPDSSRPSIGLPPSTLLPVPPVAHLPTSRKITPPLRIPAHKSIETTLIRPLPLIPDPVQDSPAPPLSSKPPRLRSQPPPTVKIPQPLSHGASNTRSTQPSDAPPVPRLKHPGISRNISNPIEYQSSRNSRSPATPRMKKAELTRFVSLPLLSSRLLAHESVSPCTTPSPNRSRSGSATRSPPLGPRPRSTITSS